MISIIFFLVFSTAKFESNNVLLSLNTPVILCAVRVSLFIGLTLLFADGLSCLSLVYG